MGAGCLLDGNCCCSCFPNAVDGADEKLQSRGLIHHLLFNLTKNDLQAQFARSLQQQKITIIYKYLTTLPSPSRVLRCERATERRAGAGKFISIIINFNYSYRLESLKSKRILDFVFIIQDTIVRKEHKITLATSFAVSAAATDGSIDDGTYLRETKMVKGGDYLSRR